MKKRTEKFSLVKVIRKQDPINPSCLLTHKQFRVITGCKECRNRENGVPAKECKK